MWQGSDALGGPGRWAYAGAYQTDEAAQQAVVEAYKRQYVFNSACGRATDTSNTYHYAFYACDYLPDVVGKDISFDPSVDVTAARVGTVKLVRKDFRGGGFLNVTFCCIQLLGRGLDWVED